jgi:outer membrane protein insertion porin family
MRTHVLSLLAIALFAPPASPQSVEQVLIRGNRRIPESTIRIWITTREGDAYDPSRLDRDIRTLAAQGYFADVKAFAEDGPRGGKVVTFRILEHPLILAIDYQGLKSVPLSTVAETFRKRQVALSKDSQYDPVKVRRAAAVIKELLAGEGYADASVIPEVEQLSQTSVQLTFKIDEGPRYRVARIEFTGNTAFSSAYLRSQMKLIKQAGLVTAFTSADIYHKEKLEADLQRLRVLVYAENGYLLARFGEPTVEQAGELRPRAGVLGRHGHGLKIVIPVIEGRQYKVGLVNIEDNAAFPAEDLKALLGIKPGDVVHGYSAVQKGIETLKKLYGSRGYVQFDAEPQFDFHDSPVDPGKGVADVTFELHEGKQFILRRLEFLGNHFTRENVLRREVLLSEGDRYNQQLWDLSLLRLNQLGYFEQIQPDDVTINTNEREGKLDATVKLQEKGRQQISLTGGVSGAQGSSIGLQYQTNNLLGYGESLGVTASTGRLQNIFSLAVTEPYLRDRPISVGFNMFYQDYKFLGTGLGFLSPLNASDTRSLFTEVSKGAGVSVAAPFSYLAPRSPLARFTKLGLSYSYSTTDVKDPAVNNDQNPNNDIAVTFREKGVKQSTVTPSISYNALNGTLDPTTGQSLTIQAPVTGGVFGGNVNTIRPSIEFKLFRPLLAGPEANHHLDPRKTRTFGFRASFGNISPFGARFDSNSASFVDGTPLTSRFYLGGDDSLRGYGERTIAPLVQIDRTFNTSDVYAVGLNGNRLKVKDPSRATANSVAPDVIDQFTVTGASAVAPTFLPIGADSQALINLEYRIPLFGPVSFVPFLDAGSVFNLRRLGDQSIHSQYGPAILNDGTAIILDPRGEIATQREINHARTPETPPGALPPGFKQVFIHGSRQDVSRLDLADSIGGLLRNSRASLGGELRIQVPVLNIPVRLIFAWNPDARTNNRYVIEASHAIRFSIGRTF